MDEDNNVAIIPKEEKDDGKVVVSLTHLKLECQIKILGYMDANSLWRKGCSGICQTWWTIINGGTDNEDNHNNVFWKSNPHLIQNATALMEELIDYGKSGYLVNMFRRGLYWDFQSSNGLVAGYRVGHKPNSPINNVTNNAEAIRDFSKAGAVVQSMLDVLKEGEATEKLSQMLGTHETQPVVPFIIKYQQEYVNLTVEEWMKQRSEHVQEMVASWTIDGRAEEGVEYTPIEGGSMVATGVRQILRRVLSLRDVSEEVWEGASGYQGFWDQEFEEEDSEEEEEDKEEEEEEEESKLPSSSSKIQKAQAVTKARSILEGATTDPLVYSLDMTDSESVTLYFWCGRIGHYSAGLMFMVELDS